MVKQFNFKLTNTEQWIAPAKRLKTYKNQSLRRGLKIDGLYFLKNQ